MNVELTPKQLDAVLRLVREELEYQYYGFRGRYTGRLKRAKEQLEKAKDLPKEKNKNLTTPMKVLLESLKEDVYDGHWTEIYQNEFRTAKALELRGYVEVDGLLARVKGN